MYRNFISNLYIVYELNTWPRIPTSSFTLKNCLFGTVKFTRNSNKSNFTNIGWGKAFDGKVFWSFRNDTARNVRILCVNNSLSPHVDNLKNNFLVLGEGPQGSSGSVGAAEKKNSINFGKANTRFCLG